ncbi:MAG: 2-iminoacetate synthase ThiH [Deferribacteraceae bacterium]|jgi:2-iminoacetate synthase|nr:2-iminoacetate synthase ThiH [Deferribacteraceae bacterium]
MFSDEIYSRINFSETVNTVALTTVADAEKVLSNGHFDISTLPILLSAAAADYLEDMAQIAVQRTRERFGNTVLLYAPLYLSNECSNSCLYCGFSLINKDIHRRTLALSEVEREFIAIQKAGIKHILLVSGEHPAKVNLEYLKEALQIGHTYAASLGIEIYPLETEGYKLLSNSGAETLTIYQETYEERRYGEVHPAGRKKDFFWRLSAPDRAGEAGFRGIGVGSLLGLNENTAADVYFAALHADYLRSRYWRTSINISLPRLKYAANGFNTYAVSDAEYVQYILALRLVLGDVGITLSTREESSLRNNLIGLGITQMSAASKTEPGGYSDEYSGQSGATPQFQVEDSRSVEEVTLMLKSKGIEGLIKDNWRLDFS